MTSQPRSRGRSWARWLTAAATVVLIVMPLGGVSAEVTRAQLDEARTAVNEKQAEVDRELAALDAIVAQEGRTLARIEAINADIIDRDRQIGLSEVAAKERAYALYVNFGSADDVPGVISPESIGSVGAKTAYVEALVDQDRDAVNDLIVLQEDRGRLNEELDVLLAELVVMEEEIQEIMEGLLGELEVINADYRTLADQWEREERARQVRAAQEAARQTGFFSSAHVDPSGRTCPIPPGYGNAFRDSWKEPRPYRNGQHHGTDVIAATGTPLVAMENGVITRGSPSWHWAGGNQIYLRGDSGDIYYYAHMHSFAPGIANGTRVGVRQVIGTVGNTGASSTPHLHLGFQPGGGPLTNPYQLLVRLCR